MSADAGGSRWHDLPFALVLVGVVAAVAATGGLGFRAGGLVLAGTALVAAALRLVLPVRWAGALAVRSKLTDVLMLGMLAGCVGALALAVPDM